MKSITKTLRRLFGVSRQPSLEEANAAMRQLFGVCPICQSEMVGHQYFRLASVLLDDRDKNEEVGNLIAEENWDQVVAFQDWRGDQNEREYYGVRCSTNNSRCLLVTVVSMWDLWTDDFTESRRLLDQPSSTRLAKVVGDRWRKM